MVLSLNPFFVLEDDPTPSRGSQLPRAASLILSSLGFIHDYRQGDLEVSSRAPSAPPTVKPTRLTMLPSSSSPTRSEGRRSIWTSIRGSVTTFSTNAHASARADVMGLSFVERNSCSGRAGSRLSEGARWSFTSSQSTLSSSEGDSSVGAINVRQN